MPVIQLRNDSTDSPIFIERSKIRAVQVHDGRTVVMFDDSWQVYVSETLPEVLALWTMSIRITGVHQPITTIKNVPADYLEACNKLTAKVMP